MEEILRTERLTVRKFMPADSGDLAEILSDPEVTYFEPYETFTAEACIKEAENFAASDEFFAVVLGGKVIGKIYFSRQKYGTAEIGYTFGRAFQGKGYACESVHAFMGYAFGKLGVRRIIAEIDTRNKRSASLAKRLGMRIEGEHKQVFPRKEDPDKYNDLYIFAMLKSEYSQPKKGGVI